MRIYLVQNARDPGGASIDVLEIDLDPLQPMAGGGIGYFHIDIAELSNEGGKGFLCFAADRTSKLVFARIYRGYQAGRSPIPQGSRQDLALQDPNRLD